MFPKAESTAGVALRIDLQGGLHRRERQPFHWVHEKALFCEIVGIRPDPSKGVSVEAWGPDGRSRGLNVWGVGEQ